MLNVTFDGTVEKKETREDGQFHIDVDTTSPLFRYFCVISVYFCQHNACAIIGVFQLFVGKKCLIFI